MNAVDAVIQLGQWAQAHSREVLMGMGAVPVLLGGTHLLTRRRRGADVLGSARWATWPEVRRAGLVQRHGVVLGKMQGRLLCDNGEAHVLLLAPTRAGKGVAHIIPTLLTWRGSALILDPKVGENAEVTARWRGHQRGLGQRVERFTPCAAPQCRMNVLDTIRLKTRHEFADAQVIAQSLTAADKQARETSNSIHFRELAALLLSAGLLHVCYTAPCASLAAVWHFFTQQHRSVAACLKTMARTAHTSHGVHQAITSMTTAIQNISGDRELSSVWTTVIRPLVLYSDPLVAASTDTSTLAFETLQYGPTPVSLYLIAPSTRALTRLYPLYRVILEVAMARLMDHRPRTWDHRLLVCADELPLHGYMAALDKGAADMAGYGIKGLYVGQDLAQLEDTYGEKNAIWGNTPTKMFHAPAHDLMAKRISEHLLGRGTVAHPVESRQEGMGGRRSVSMQEVGRPLLTPDELMELAPAQAVVRVSGCKPLLVEKVDYRRDQPFVGRRHG